MTYASAKHNAVVEACRQAVRQITEPLERAQRFSELLQWTGHPGDGDEALAAAAQIDDTQQRANNLHGIIYSFLQRGMFDRARAVDMESDLYRALTLPMVFRHTTDRADLESAQHAYEAINEHEGRSSALETLAPALAWAGDIDAMLQYVRAIEDPLARWRALIHTLEQMTQWKTSAAATGADARVSPEQGKRVTEACRQAAQAVSSPIKRSEVFSQIAEYTKSPDDCDASLEALAQIDDPQDKAYRQQRVLEDLVMCGAVDRARSMALTLPASVEQVRILSAVFCSSNKRQDLQHAQEAYEAMTADDTYCTALGTLVEPLVRAQAFEILLQYAEQVDDASYRWTVLFGALGFIVPPASKQGTAQCTHTEWADRVIDACRQTVRQIAAPQERAQSFAGLLQQTGHPGDGDEALAAAAQIDDAQQQGGILHGIVYDLIKCQLVDRARSVAADVSSDGQRAETYAMIFHHTKDRADVEHAQQAYVSISDHAERSRVLVGVAPALAEAGDIDTLLEHVRALENPLDRWYALFGVLPIVMQRQASIEASS